MKELMSGLMILLTLGMLLIPVKLSPPVETVPETTVEISSQWEIPVRSGAKVEKMDLEVYLTGAVLGEMPIWFEEEALKAQAVAARTFALKAYTTGGKHGDGSVCTDAGCCQAYRTPEGEIEAIRQAVAETAGQVLTYDGELIDAVYFSCSGGNTEDAVAVWGQEVPYLQSVDSPGEEGAGAYFQERHFTQRELEETLEVSLPEDPKQWFCNAVYTEGGGIATVEIGGKIWGGVELRKRLGLHSTRIRIRQDADGIILHTYGYGHRVGMSQYGADAMAAGGADYERILSHYYTGAEITDFGKLCS